MKAQDFLKQVQKLDKLIENKLAEVQRWKEIANNTTVNMSGERVQSTGNHDTVANAICTYLDLEAEINASIVELVATRQDIINVIEQLNPTYYDILHKLYVQYFTLQEVATMYDMSYNWATTTHGRALKQVQIILNKREEKKNDIT